MTSLKTARPSKLKLAAVLALQGASVAFADGFGTPYANQDLLLNVRQYTPPPPSGGVAGTYNVTYDLGNVLTFLTTYGGQSVQINSAAYMRPNAFDASLLTSPSGANYGTMNNLLFSVAATDFTANVDDIWVTRARGSNPDNTVPDSVPWTEKTAFSHSGASGKIGSVGVNAQNFGLTLSPTAVRTTDSSANSYNTISSGGTFNNYFTGSTEAGTGSAFASGDTIRMDFYEVKHTASGTAPAEYKGYFEVKGNGDLTYVSAQAVPEPSTYALFGLGVAALVARRKKNMANAS